MRAEVNFNWIKPDMSEEKIHLSFAEPVNITRIYQDESIEVVKDTLNQLNDQQMYHLLAIDYEAARMFNPSFKVKSVKNPVIKIYSFDQASELDERHQKPHSIQFKMQESKDEIIKKIETIQNEIRKGNTYQVNYTTRLLSYQTHISDAFPFFKRVKESNNGAYQAFIEDEASATISMSPELFFQYDEQSGTVLTKPMKGTMKRSGEASKDRALYQKLINSNKDKAENVMITDLLRNDLSIIAEKGTVDVPSLFEVTAYDTVYQMTSTITAKLKNKSLFDILSALFPCGSITGAPKVSTMRIIDTLENTPRGIYCGTIGLITPEQKMIFNVPIRTMTFHNETCHYSAGGGMTIDSVPSDEYDEILQKTAVLNQIGHVLTRDFHLIETMRIKDGVLLRGKYHQERLKSAMNHFNILPHIDRYFDVSFIESLSDEYKTSDLMYRLTVNIDGKVTYTLKPFQPYLELQRADIQKMNAVQKEYHLFKTSYRDHYKGTSDLTLFYNDKRLLEFNIGNVVYEIEGKQYTPFINDEILNGCMRQSLIKEGELIEQDISIDELLDLYVQKQVKIYMINSLREWVEIELDVASFSI